MNKSIIALPIDNQRGATLIIALIMLLLLTIIGLSSMRGPSLQESMAGNMRDSHLALQAAEAALRQGENVVNKKFMTNTLDALSSTPLAGTYNKFPGVATAPAYSITLLAKLRTDTEAGMPIDDQGALVRVEADGYGMALNSDNSAASKIKLRSVFLVEQ